MHWQSIDTAPKDGTLVDLWIINASTKVSYRLADCSFDDEWLDKDGEPLRHSENPTHWICNTKPLI